MMWQEINAYAMEAISENTLTIDKLNETLRAANGDGELALAHLFLMDLVHDANELDIKIRRFALAINPAVRAEAAREKEGG